MRPKIKKRTYQWRNAIERLQYIRKCIALEETLLHSQEWAVTKTKAKLERLERDRGKVAAGLVKRA